MHSFSYKNGRLACEGVDLATIADGVGTPVYVYSAATILAHCRRLDAAFAGMPHHISYAVKANPNLSILRLVAQAGAGFDIVSGGELRRVLRAGGSAAGVTFAGVGKSRREIADALDAGVYCLVAESEPEIERIAEIAREKNVAAPVAFRINPDVEAGTHAHITTGTKQNKFGIAYDDAPAIYERASRHTHLHIRGVQMHIGSQITATQPFVEAVKKLAPLATQLKIRHNIEFFSIGGGLGITYENALASGTDTPIAFETYAAALRSLLKPLGLKILIEPGRSIVGNAGVLLTTVEYIKKNSEKTFVIADAAMNDLIRPALYDGQHEIVPLSQVESSRVPQTQSDNFQLSTLNSQLALVDVVGPICESTDFLAKNRPMPPVAAGDRLAVMSAGAYGASMSSTYNSRPLLPEALVEGDRWRLIRRRQTFDEMLALEMPAP